MNPRTRRPFIWHMFHARPGGGATVAGDGWETAGEGQAAGGIKFGSIEVAEARFPLTFEHHEFRADSGGDGMHRGGVGAVLRLRVDVEEPAVANTAGDGVRHAPYGLLGGGDGLPHRYRLRSRGGQTRVLKTKEVGIVVRPGDVFLVESSGGGGYGPARRRSRRGAPAATRTTASSPESATDAAGVADDLLASRPRARAREPLLALPGHRGRRGGRGLGQAARAHPRRAAQRAPARPCTAACSRPLVDAAVGGALGTYGSAAAGGVDQATLDLNVTYIAAPRAAMRSSPRARSSAAAAPSPSARPA